MKAMTHSRTAETSQCPSDMVTPNATRSPSSTNTNTSFTQKEVDRLRCWRYSGRQGQFPLIPEPVCVCMGGGGGGGPPLFLRR